MTLKAMTMIHYRFSKKKHPFSRHNIKHLSLSFIKIKHRKLPLIRAVSLPIDLFLSHAAFLYIKLTIMDLLVWYHSQESSFVYHNPLCMFAQTVEWLQSQRVDECSSCDIEILYNRPPLNEPTTLSDGLPQSTPPSPGSQSCPPLQAEYCPQSVTVLLRDREALLCVTNKAYFHTAEEYLSEAQVRLSDIYEPSESLQESCSVEYGYISNDTAVSAVEYEDQRVPA